MHRLAVIEPDGTAFQVAGPLDSYNEALAAIPSAEERLGDADFRVQVLVVEGEGDDATATWQDAQAPEVPE